MDPYIDPKYALAGIRNRLGHLDRWLAGDMVTDEEKVSGTREFLNTLIQTYYPEES